jgi:hypothetical protein
MSNTRLELLLLSVHMGINASQSLRCEEKESPSLLCLGSFEMDAGQTPLLSIHLPWLFFSTLSGDDGVVEATWIVEG